MDIFLTNIKQLITLSSDMYNSQSRRVRVGKEMQNLGIIENAGLVINDGKIAWYGKMEDLPAIDKNVNDFDCSNKIVMPGFVDSHTHLLFGGSREDEFAMRTTGATYQQIAEKGGGIINTVRSTRAASKKLLKKSSPLN